MKSAVVSAYGDETVLSVVADAEEPQNSDDTVTVRVAFASVNPFDIALMSGMYKDMMPLSFPVVPGGDFSGTVMSVGRRVTEVAPGDAVFGTALTLNGGSGAFAETARVSPARIAAKPDTLSFAEAAAFPLIGSSAVQALEESMKVSRGQRILIHGGAGGIGHIAIQLAKYHGAYVATTVSGDDKEFVRSLGADEAIDYKTERFETKLRAYDAVYDTVGGEITDRSFAVLKRGGVLVSMKGAPNATLAKTYGVTGIGQNTKTDTLHLRRVAELAGQRAIVVHIDREYPLSDVRTAWLHQRSGHPRGKIAIRIG